MKLIWKFILAGFSVLDQLLKSWVFGVFFCTSTGILLSQVLAPDLQQCIQALYFGGVILLSLLMHPQGKDLLCGHKRISIYFQEKKQLKFLLFKACLAVDLTGKERNVLFNVPVLPL